MSDVQTFTPDQMIQLCDFGIASMAAGAASYTINGRTITRSSQLMAMRQYYASLSPNFADGNGIGFGSALAQFNDVSAAVTGPQSGATG